MKILMLIFFFVVACSSATKIVQLFEDPAVTSGAEAPAQYQQGLRQLGAEQYSDALSTFDGFLRAQPTSRYTQVAIFNSGRALEGLERWHEAIERYRAVVQATRKAPRLQALALYQLSFPYEAVGDDIKSVSTLTDAMARSQFLPDQIASAELQARLASAYARVGNVDQAMVYYTKAESGIARLKHQNGNRKAPAWLARTLYLMGRVTLKEISWNDFEATLRPIDRAQFYLLQAVELDDAKWSEEALKELQQVYANVIAVLKFPPEQKDDDQVLAAREAQKRQWDLTELTLASVRRLRTAKPPPEKTQSKRIDLLFSHMATVEKDLTSILNQPLVGEGLTPEARERKSKPRGRVVSPNDKLEREYQKVPAPKSTTAQEDPNL